MIYSMLNMLEYIRKRQALNKNTIIKEVLIWALSLIFKWPEYFCFWTNEGVQMSLSIWLFPQMHAISPSHTHQIITRRNPMRMALKYFWILMKFWVEWIYINHSILLVNLGGKIVKLNLNFTFLQTQEMQAFSFFVFNKSLIPTRAS